MIVYTNKKGEIKAVETTEDTSLIPLYIDDNVNPFETWSKAKICCYKVRVDNGIVTMMTPYVDTKFIEHINMMGEQTDRNTRDINDMLDAEAEMLEMICMLELTDLSNE